MLLKNLRPAAVLLTIAISVLPSGAASAGNSPWQITFQPSPAIWKVATADKTLIVKLTNASNRTLWAFESNPLNDYQLMVASLQGQPIPMTSKGRLIQENQRGTLFRVVRENLAPGGSHETNINLVDLYDLAPGKYTVHAQLRVDTQDIVDEKTFRRKPNQPPGPAGSTTIEITP